MAICNADIFMIYFAIFKNILFFHMRIERQCLGDMHFLFCEMYFHLKLLFCSTTLFINFWKDDYNFFKKERKSRKNSSNSECYLDFYLFRVHEQQQEYLFG